jgi:hypothetical protein
VIAASHQRSPGFLGWPIRSALPQSPDLPLNIGFLPFGGGQASGRHNCNLGEDQQQNSQPLRNAKQANSGPYRSDHDCIISQRNRCVGRRGGSDFAWGHLPQLTDAFEIGSTGIFLSYQHHSAPCPSNNHGDSHDSDHYGKDASKHGSPPSCLTISNLAYDLRGVKDGGAEDAGRSSAARLICGCAQGRMFFVPTSAAVAVRKMAVDRGYGILKKVRRGYRPSD